MGNIIRGYLNADEKRTGKKTTNQTVKQAWDFALALNKMAGLTPSEDFLEIIEMEKRGEIQREGVKKFLEQKYRVTMVD